MKVRPIKMFLVRWRPLVAVVKVLQQQRRKSGGVVKLTELTQCLLNLTKCLCLH